MNTATNDVSSWTPNFQVYGNSYIVWGTEGIANSLGSGSNNNANNINVYIVLSASESQRIEEIDISNGAGFTAIVVLLMDGITVDIEVIDDTGITPPTIANNPFNLVTPFGTIPMLLVKNDANQAPKREGHRSFTFKSFSGISGLH
jgi:hypothetical protein